MLRDCQLPAEIEKRNLLWTNSLGANVQSIQIQSYAGQLEDLAPVKYLHQPSHGTRTTADFD